MWPSILMLFCMLGASAQDHFGISVNESGIQYFIQSLLKNNSIQSKSLQIPSDLHEITIKQKDLLSNPLIATLNEISNINLKKDLKIYLRTSDISVKAMPDPKSFKISIQDVTPSGFIIQLNAKFSKLNLHAPFLELCETQDRLKKINCGKGLKLSVTDFSVSTIKKPVDLSISVKVNLVDGVASAKVLDVKTNFTTKLSPKLSIKFKKFYVPRIAIIINGQETELDTSTLEQKVLEKREYLSAKMLKFLSGFIAQDLVNNLNRYLKEKNISTTISIFRKDPLLFKDDFRSGPHDFVKSFVAFNPIENGVVPAEDVVQKIIETFGEVIRQAKLDMTIKSLRDVGQQIFLARGMIDFILNQTRFKVGNTLGNSNRTIPSLNVESHPQDHFSLTLSEPVINGALDLANSTGLFKDIFEQVIKEKSVSLRNLKLHFFTAQSFKFISNIEIDLKKLRQSFWRNPVEWAETEIGIWLERNNNNSVIYFPLEFEILPVIHNSEDGEAKLSLKISSAFDGDSLLNTYNYPTNVGKMYQIVRKAVLNKLRSQMDQFENKIFEIDITKFTRKTGVIFKPKSIEFIDKAYIKFNGDILDVKLKKD